MNSRHNFYIHGRVLLALLFGLLSLPAGSVAQSPDLRQIQPFIALVVDSSGSMERLPGCVCTTKSCVECLPNCDLVNDGTTGEPPANKKNRWAVTLEALTGTIENFECRALERTVSNGMSYDEDYFMPYHQPWDCSSSPTSCKAYPSSGTSEAVFTQRSDGILDNYSGRVRFGLMTFDGWGTYVGAEPLVAHGVFDWSRSETVDGLWSYGSYTNTGSPILRLDGSQPGRFHYPNCATDYMIDTGIRGPQAPEGGLISLNTPLCATPPCDSGLIAEEIQRRLIDTRPYGGTPIAASLDDLYHHINADLGADSYGSCRSRYGLLITDGYPDDDYRAFGCDCTQNSDPGDPGYCGGGSNNPADMFCPYPRPEEVAYDLVTGRVDAMSSQDNPPLQQLYVVGLSIVDPAVRDRLNLIAQQGASPQQADGNFALFADDGDPNTNDLDVLRQTIDAVVAQTIEPVSRSVPLFVRGQQNPQYQISTGFDVAARAGDPWMGFIERKRFTCQGSTVQEEDITPQDEFHNVLRNQGTRTLLTSNAGQGNNDGAISALNCPGCSTPVPLRSLGPVDLGLASSDTATFSATIGWMYGDAGTRREPWPISDIFHSSPIAVGSPDENSNDESFNLFRRRSEVSDRPLTLFINSNDGILHAFAIEDWSPTISPSSGPPVSAGQEMWGFVAPMFLNDLPNQLIQHSLSADGTPVVKDVYFDRSSSGLSSAEDYHTVLITGMRGGGRGYMALDITNVHSPRFLWQFTDDGSATTGSATMGLTYGRPAITQSSYRVSGTPKQGAVAILPGGFGNRGIGTGCNAGTMQQDAFSSSITGTRSFSYAQPAIGSAQLQHRSRVPCWEDVGRSLYFIDIETGALIKKIDESVFTAPLVGTPVVFTNEVGTVGTRAYVMDADGIMWRIDMSGTDPVPNDPERGWTARPFHDFFYDENWSSTGVINEETSYEAPLLTTDESGRVVVILGTGDTDNFEKTTVRNRIYSLVELTDGQGTSVPADQYRAGVNWELRAAATGASPSQTSSTTSASYDGMEMSELVTGKMILLEGQVFAATYISVPPSDPCDVGLGRFWALHYNQSDTNQPTGSGTFGPARLDISSDFNVAASAATPDLLVMGLSLVEQPDCNAINNAYPDPVFGMYQSINSGPPPATFLVAQGAGSAATRVASSALRSIQVQVRTPQVPAVLNSWGGPVE